MVASQISFRQMTAPVDQLISPKSHRVLEGRVAAKGTGFGGSIGGCRDQIDS